MYWKPIPDCISSLKPVAFSIIAVLCSRQFADAFYIIPNVDENNLILTPRVPDEDLSPTGILIEVEKPSNIIEDFLRIDPHNYILESASDNDDAPVIVPFENIVFDSFDTRDRDDAQAALVTKAFTDNLSNAKVVTPISEDEADAIEDAKLKSLENIKAQLEADIAAKLAKKAIVEFETEAKKEEEERQEEQLMLAKVEELEANAEQLNKLNALENEKRDEQEYLDRAEQLRHVFRKKRSAVPLQPIENDENVLISLESILPEISILPVENNDDLAEVIVNTDEPQDLLRNAQLQELEENQPYDARLGVANDLNDLAPFYSIILATD